MRQMTSGMIALAVVMTVFVTGCATHRGEAVSSAAQSEGAALAKESDLKGTWRGSFGQVTTGDSGQIHGNVLTQINGDGTYKTTWTTLLVAGSARGGQMELAGTVRAQGTNVTFDDARSGRRITLKRDGDTLYGVTIDPATKRVTVAVELHKVSSEVQAP